MKFFIMPPYLPLLHLALNPHTFDAETSEGNLVSDREIDLESRNQQIEFSCFSLRKTESYLLAGILINDISNYATLSCRALKR